MCPLSNEEDIERKTDLFGIAPTCASQPAHQPVAFCIVEHDEVAAARNGLAELEGPLQQEGGT